MTHLFKQVTSASSLHLRRRCDCHSNQLGRGTTAPEISELVLRERRLVLFGWDLLVKEDSVLKGQTGLVWHQCQSSKTSCHAGHPNVCLRRGAAQGGRVRCCCRPRRHPGSGLRAPETPGPNPIRSDASLTRGFHSKLQLPAHQLPQESELRA